MKQWWLSRSPQDKLALMLGGGALSLLLCYLLLWIPFTQQVENRKMLLDGQRRTLQWIQQQAAEVDRLKQRQSSRERPSNAEALLTLVDRTAQQNQLRGFIKRLKPDGGSAVQIWVEQAPFDNLIDWLGLLVNQHAILLESVSIERQDKAGIINAKVNLQREAG